MKEITYPIRLNKYLAYSGLCSRREADRLIENKKVYVNGKVAKLGVLVEKGDLVDMHRGYKKDYIYLAYNKPTGVVTHSAQGDEIDIAESISRDDVFPVGRLDKDSDGLLILTNDGRVTERLLSPEANHEKEYVVNVDKTLSNSAVTKLETGVNIEGYITKPAKAKKLQPKVLSITLTEGKKHQVRRMLAALGYSVKRLKRIRVGSIVLGGLSKNKTRALEADELSKFLKDINL